MRKIIALDTNLLVLYLVGLTDCNLIAVHKRLKTFLVDDFTLLIELIENSAGLVVTPNALTEASNLLSQIPGPAKTRIAQTFQQVIANTPEIYLTSVASSSRPEFIRLGLSDSAFLELSSNRQNIVILSADLHLYLAALDAGYQAINFNHLRDQ